MRLIDIAHARSGDKGDISNIAVFLYDQRDFSFVADYLTAERVRALFASIISGAVERFELPNLSAFNFILHEALDGGVNQSLALDSHGKSFASILLEMELPERHELDDRLGETQSCA